MAELQDRRLYTIAVTTWRNELHERTVSATRACIAKRKAANEVRDEVGVNVLATRIVGSGHT